MDSDLQKEKEIVRKLTSHCLGCSEWSFLILSFKPLIMADSSEQKALLLRNQALEAENRVFKTPSLFISVFCSESTAHPSNYRIGFA
jgi:hypothetical protein